MALPDKSNPRILFSDPNAKPNPKLNHNPHLNPNPNPNDKFDLIPYMAMSRDVTRSNQFFADILSGNHYNPTACWMIRNLRSKIRRSNIIVTDGDI